MKAPLLCIALAACAVDAGDDLKEADAGPGSAPSPVAAAEAGTFDGGALFDQSSPAPEAAPPDDSGAPEASVDAKPDVVSCPTCMLRVQYLCSATAATNNEIKPHYTILNMGSAPQAMSELTVRYWYTVDVDKPQEYDCDYAKIGCANVSATFQKLSAPVTGADSYMEISFSSGAGSIAAGDQSGEIQNRFHHTDYSNFDQTSDYSFDPSKTQFADWDHVTLYRNGTLVWGVEPK